MSACRFTVFFWLYCITTVTPFIRRYYEGSNSGYGIKKPVNRQADTETRWNISQVFLWSFISFKEKLYLKLYSVRRSHYFISHTVDCNATPKSSNQVDFYLKHAAYIHTICDNEYHRRPFSDFYGGEGTGGHGGLGASVHSPLRLTRGIHYKLIHTRKTCICSSWR